MESERPVKMSNQKDEKKVKVTGGSGNVFADRGYPHPEHARAKAQLAKQIYDVIRKRGLTQEAAGKIMGIGQSKVSEIVCGDLSRYTIDRLIRYMRSLGVAVEIKTHVLRATSEKAPLTVIVEAPLSRTRRSA